MYVRNSMPEFLNAVIAYISKTNNVTHKSKTTTQVLSEIKNIIVKEIAEIKPNIHKKKCQWGPIVILGWPCELNNSHIVLPIRTHL